MLCHARGRTAAVAFCVVALSGCDRTAADSARILKADDPQVLAAGRTVYETHCAACHGAQLQGEANWRERDAAGRLPAPPHDASGHTWHHSDELLFRLTKYGPAKAANLGDYPTSMPAYEGVLSDGDIIAVLSWIKSRWPPDIRKHQEEVTRRAAQQR